MAITYNKLRDGSWGIRAEGVVIERGQTVTVTKKSGETKEETIGRILWTGNGVTLATIVSSSNGVSGEGGARRRSGNVCAECGKGGNLVQDCEDGMMKHYNCCDIPPG